MGSKVWLGWKTLDASNTYASVIGNRTMIVEDWHIGEKDATLYQCLGYHTTGGGFRNTDCAANSDGKCSACQGRK